jgi:hypothetical protein
VHVLGRVKALAKLKAVLLLCIPVRQHFVVPVLVLAICVWSAIPGWSHIAYVIDCWLCKQTTSRFRVQMGHAHSIHLLLNLVLSCHKPW